MRADVDVTTDLALALLRAQHPDLLELSDRRLEVGASGWDNVVMRLGDDLALRLPRREAAAHLVEHEQGTGPRPDARGAARRSAVGRAAQPVPRGASDLATAWLSFDAAGHAAFRAAYVAAGGTADAATWVRARAWAASLALALLAFPDDHPLMAEVGRHAVARLGAEA